MKTLCPFPCDAGAAVCPCDYGHAALGFFSVFIPREFQAGVFSLFVLYEMARAKPCNSKSAAFLQFGAGYVSGQALARMRK